MSELIKLEVGILDGVSKPTIDKFVGAGITTIQALSMQTPKDIAEKAGMGTDTAEKAINKAVAFISNGYITATQLQDQRKNRTHLHTGSKALDELLGGGIESETTLEIAGSMASGKTQIAHTLAVLAQQPIEQGGLNGEVAFIDSENTFVPKRIIEICEARGIDPVATLNRIYHGASMNVNHQQLLIEQLYDLCPTHNIKLVIVDSIIGHLRSEYIGRGTLSDRQGLLNKMLHTLSKIALSTKVTVVYTNQVLSDPAIQYGNPEKPTGGNVIGHSASNRLHLRKGRQNIRIANLIDSLSLPPGEAPFMITEMGIQDLPSHEKEEEKQTESENA